MEESCRVVRVDDAGLEFYNVAFEFARPAPSFGRLFSPLPIGASPKQLKAFREASQLFAGFGVSYHVEVHPVELGKKVQTAVLMTAVLIGGMVLAGCNDDVEVLHDPDVKVTKGMTWAWRPMTPPAAAATRSPDGRPVVSRDVIAPPPEQQQHLESNRDWNTEANRKQLQNAIERV